MANSSDTIKDAINEFSSVQKIMKSAKEENAQKTYELLKDRYIELKVLLQTLGVNLSELDRIKESAMKLETYGVNLQELSLD